MKRSELIAFTAGELNENALVYVAKLVDEVLDNEEKFSTTTAKLLCLMKEASTIRIYKLLAKRCYLRAELAKANVYPQWHIAWMRGYEKYMKLAKEVEK